MQRSFQNFIATPAAWQSADSSSLPSSSTKVDTLAVHLHRPLKLERLQDGSVFGHEAEIGNERRQGDNTCLLCLQPCLGCEALHAPLPRLGQRWNSAIASSMLNPPNSTSLPGASSNTFIFWLQHVILLCKVSSATYLGGAHLPHDLRMALGHEHFVICYLLSDHGGRQDQSERGSGGCTDERERRKNGASRVYHQRPA